LRKQLPATGTQPTPGAIEHADRAGGEGGPDGLLWSSRGEVGEAVVVEVSPTSEALTTADEPLLATAGPAVPTITATRKSRTNKAVRRILNIPLDGRHRTGAIPTGPAYRPKYALAQEPDQRVNCWIVRHNGFSWLETPRPA